MKIGFIGAGKVGFSLSRYLNDKYHNVIGIYSKNDKDAIECAKFSISEYYSNINDLIYDCDTLFLTVNDDSIIDVVNLLIKLNIRNKILIHTSGSVTTDIFKELNLDNYCYSIHPICAFNDKYESYKILNDIYFTLEGNIKYQDELNKLFNNKIIIIDKDNKVKYHLASSMISNMVCGIFDVAKELYNDCGIKDEKIYMPLFINNVNNIIKYGPINALTGPIIRNDIDTVKKHIKSIEGDELMIYKYLGLHLIKMSEEKTNNNYDNMKKILEEI